MSDYLIGLEEEMNEYGYDNLSREDQEMAKDFFGYHDLEAVEQIWS